LRVERRPGSEDANVGTEESVEHPAKLAEGGSEAEGLVDDYAAGLAGSKKLQHVAETWALQSVAAPRLTLADHSDE
jgi:hypothetical protein